MVAREARIGESVLRPARPRYLLVIFSSNIMAPSSSHPRSSGSGNTGAANVTANKHPVGGNPT